MGEAIARKNSRRAEERGPDDVLSRILGKLAEMGYQVGEITRVRNHLLVYYGRLYSLEVKPEQTWRISQPTITGEWVRNLDRTANDSCPKRK